MNNFGYQGGDGDNNEVNGNYNCQQEMMIYE
jgi:hypothetical protein